MRTYMITKAIIKNNVKKIEIEKTEDGIVIEIGNVIDNEKVSCFAFLTKDEVKLFISQLSTLNEH